MNQSVLIFPSARNGRTGIAERNDAGFGGAIEFVASQRKKRVSDLIVTPSDLISEEGRGRKGALAGGA